MIGTIIDGKYQIRKLLGEGAMGSVYEAEHTGTGRRCAVKVISSADLTRDPKVVSRFQREARAAGAIDTQHITQVLDAGVDRGSNLPFLAMEFLAGEDVHQLIKRVGPLAPDLALRIVAQSCLGLQKAHEASVVHRDIKPHNLFLARRDAGEILVKLLDFGIAKVKMDRANETEGADLTRTGNLIGSPLYMSPEQARGQKEIDHRTDIWSLGAVLYQALTGRTPYHHITALGELIISICSDPPPPVQDFAPWVPPEVAAIVHRCLLQAPGQRYQSAQEMFGAIRPLLPYGWGIHESMLVPLPEAVHRQSAPRFSVNVSIPPANQSGAYAAVSPANQSGGYPALAASPVNPSGGYPALAASPANQSGGYPAAPHEHRGGSHPSFAPPANQSGPYGAVVPAGNHAGAATTGALTQSHRGTQPGASRVPVVAGAALLAAVIAAGAYFVSSRRSPEPVAPPVAQATAEALPTPAAIPAPAPMPPPAATGTSEVVEAAESHPRRVQVVILPADASVEIEGARAKTRNGILEITGPLGSEHRVRVFKGANEVVTDVFVTTSGARPLKIELAPPPAKGAPAPPAKSVSAAPPPPPAPTTPKGIIDNTEEFGK